MAVAYEKGNSFAVVAGVVAMFFLIILVDRCLWAPLVVWSERFKLDREGHQPLPRSFFLEMLHKSNLLAVYYDFLDRIKKEWDRRHDQALTEEEPLAPVVASRNWSPLLRAAWIFFVAMGGVAFVFGIYSMVELVAATPGKTWLLHIRDTFFTLLRVTAATLLGALWAVPLGVFIGTHPTWTRRLQPVVQVVASFPAPMLFPLLTALFLHVHLSLETGAVVLMLFASQWYILFNVISGATLIPHSLIDVAAIFHVRGFHYWRAIILPAIFPSLVNGLITAAGGAWNASIVAEIVSYGEVSLSATGIGSSITRAAQAADFPSLAGGILVMVTTVVVLNRLLWGSLYRLAETKFRLD